MRELIIINQLLLLYSVTTNYRISTIYLSKVMRIPKECKLMTTLWSERDKIWKRSIFDHYLFNFFTYYIIIKTRSLLHFTICQDVESVYVLITELTDIYSFTSLPFVNRRHTPLLLCPVTINQKSPVTVRLLSHSHLLFVHTVVIALRIFRMINTSHPVRMPSLYQSAHPFFLMTIHHLKRNLLAWHSNRICRLILNRVAFKTKFILRAAS